MGTPARSFDIISLHWRVCSRRRRVPMIAMLLQRHDKFKSETPENRTDHSVVLATLGSPLGACEKALKLNAQIRQIVRRDDPPELFGSGKTYHPGFCEAGSLAPKIVSPYLTLRRPISGM